MIEQLIVEKQLVESRDLNGGITSPARERLVCYSFPTHVAFTRDLLSKATDNLRVGQSPVGEQDLEIDGRRVHTTRDAAYVLLSNGSAVYLLDKEGPDNIREGYLWQLGPGLEVSEQPFGDLAKPAVDQSPEAQQTSEPWPSTEPLFPGISSTS